MSETSTTHKPDINGKSSTDTTVVKAKKQRKTCGIPSLQALGTLPLMHYAARVEKEPTPWERIENYEFYSPSADGSRLHQKVTRSKSLDIQRQKTIPTAYGQAYRVFLEPNPSKPF